MKKKTNNKRLTNMKKITILMVAIMSLLSVCLSLTACSKDKNNIEKVLELERMVSDFNDLVSMISEDDSQELNEMLSLHIEQTEQLLEKMELEILLSGPFDDNNAIVEIHPGAGGVDSQDWAEMLFRMYVRYAERNNFKIDILDYQSGEEAGIKSATIKITGKFAYGYAKAEKGVHRLVRISPFDSNKRRHTSFASVEVTPEIEKALSLLHSILPSQTYALENIKQEILDNKYLEE